MAKQHSLSKMNTARHSALSDQLSITLIRAMQFVSADIPRTDSLYRFDG